MATTVLLVEDEVLISHLVASSLSEHGFNVHESATADEALPICQSYVKALVDRLAADERQMQEKLQKVA